MILFVYIFDFCYDVDLCRREKMRITFKCSIRRFVAQSFRDQNKLHFVYFNINDILKIDFYYWGIWDDSALLIEAHRNIGLAYKEARGSIISVPDAVLPAFPIPPHSWEVRSIQSQMPCTCWERMASSLKKTTTWGIVFGIILRLHPIWYKINVRFKGRFDKIKLLVLYSCT